MSKVIDMTKGSPARLMLTFAVPAVLTNLGQQLYQIVDAAIVGRGVGVEALAAVGCTDWIYWLILWSVSVMATGFATFVSRYFGSREYGKMNRAIATMTVLSVVIALVLTAAGLLAAKPLLRMMGTPSNILGNASVYLSTMIAGTVVVTLYNLTASILRAFGDSRSPLCAMIMAAILNILLDLLFVMVFRWGIFGAALASVLSQLTALTFCIIKILGIEYVEIDREAMRWEWRMAWDIFAFGMPLALQYIIINLSGIVLQSTINTQGSGFIAGYTAVNKLYGLLECSAISLSSAFTTFVSQNFGAEDFKRVRRGINVSAVLVLATAGIMMAVCLPLNRILPQLFIDFSEPGAAEALDVASRYLVNMIACLPVLYILYVYRSALQGTGDSIWSMISGVFEALTRIGVAKLLFAACGTGALYWSEPLSWLAAWLFVMIPYFFYQKKHVPIERKGASR